MAQDFVDPQAENSHRGREKLAGGLVFKRGQSRGVKFGRELKEVPDLMNEATKATEERMGPFNFD